MTVQEDEANQKHVAALDNTLQYWLRIADIKEEGEKDFEIAMAISTLCLAVQSVMLATTNTPSGCTPQPSSEPQSQTPKATKTDQDYRTISGREWEHVQTLRSTKLLVDNPTTSAIEKVLQRHKLREQILQLAGMLL